MRTVGDRCMAQRQRGGDENRDRCAEFASPGENVEDDIGGADAVGIHFGTGCSTAGSRSMSTAARMSAICRPPSSIPASLQRMRSIAAGSTQSRNGAPLRGGPGLRANTERRADGRRSCRRGREYSHARRQCARPAGSRCDRHRAWTSTGWPATLAVTVYLLLSNRIRRVSETDAGTDSNPSNRPTQGTTSCRSTSNAFQCVYESPAPHFGVRRPHAVAVPLDKEVELSTRPC